MFFIKMLNFDGLSVLLSVSLKLDQQHHSGEEYKTMHSKFQDEHQSYNFL